jgi:hypothetical protein
VAAARLNAIRALSAIAAPDLEDLRTIARVFALSLSRVQFFQLFELRTVEVPEKLRAKNQWQIEHLHEILATHIADLGQDQMLQVLFQIALCDSDSEPYSWRANQPDELLTAAMRHGIDVPQFEKPKHPNGGDDEELFEEQSCRKCGCTQDEPCVDDQTKEPCHWIEPDLCSFCVPAAGIEAQADG